MHLINKPQVKNCRQCHSNRESTGEGLLNWKIMLKDTPRGITFCPSSNNTPSSTPSSVGSKRKVVPKEKYNEELPSGIGDDSS